MKYYWVNLSNGENYGFTSKLSCNIFYELWNLFNMETKAKKGFDWKYSSQFLESENNR